jgi:hypothetical protein
MSGVVPCLFVERFGLVSIKNGFFFMGRGHFRLREAPPLPSLILSSFKNTLGSRFSQN